MRKLYRQLHARPLRHRVISHVVVPEYESHATIRAGGETRHGKIRRSAGSFRWSPSLQRRQQISKIIEEIIEDLQFSKRFALLPKLSQRSLEIIRLHRKIIRISRRLRFLQRTQ